MLSCIEPENEEIREWKAQIKHRNATNERLKKAVKKYITHRGSSHVNLIAQENLVQILKEQDRLHKHLIENCKLILPENILKDVFISETIKKENNFLIKDNEELKKEKQRQKQQYEETIKINNKRHREDLQRDFKKIEELTACCRFLEGQRYDLQSRNSGLVPEIITDVENLKADFASKKRRFEETLQAQNSLIEDLKRQLKVAENLVNRDLKCQQTDNIQFENENRKFQDYKEKMLHFQQILLTVKESYENEICTLKTNAAFLEQQLQNKHQENYKLQDELQNLKKEVKSLNDQYQRNDSKPISISDHEPQENHKYQQWILQTGQKYQNELSALKVNSLQFEQKLQNAYKENSYLQSQLEDRKKEIENLKLHNKNLVDGNKLHQKHASVKVENENREIYQAFEQQALHVKELNNSLVSLKGNNEQLSQHNLELQRTVTEYENQLKNASDDMNFLKLQNKTSQQQINQKNEIIERQNREIQELKEKLHPSVPPHKLEQTEEKIVEATVKATESETDDPYIQESLRMIENLCENTLSLQKQVEEYSGTDKEDKDFCHLQELLIRNMIKLDNVETEGYLVIREKRRSALKLAQEVLDTLQAKVT